MANPQTRVPTSSRSASRCTKRCTASARFGATLQRRVARLEQRAPKQGDFAPLYADAAHMLEAANKLGYAPLVAQVQQVYAELAIDAQAFDRARKLLDEALANASRGRDDRLVAEIWIRRFEIEADANARSEAIATVEEAARAAVPRLGDAALTGSLQMAIGRQRFRSGETEAASEAFEAAQAAFVSAHGASDLKVSRALHNRALIARQQGDLAGAKKLLEVALAIQRDLLGAEHPQLQQTESVLSTVLRDLCDTNGAIELAARSLAVREKMYGPKHEEVAHALQSLGGAHYIAGAHDKALDHYRRAVEILVAVRGPDHPVTGAARNNVGMALSSLGRVDEARTELEAALAVAVKSKDKDTTANVLNDLATAVATRDRAASIAYTRRAIALRIELFGPSHRLVASSQVNLGYDLVALREYDEAERHLRAALATWEASLGKTHPRIAYPLIGLGKIALARKTPAVAVDLLERALTLVADAQVDALLAAEARFALAQALSAAGRDRSRAKMLANDALAKLPDDAANADLRAEITAWVKRQR